MNDASRIFSPALIANPYPFYATLREASPVFKADPPGFWILTRYEDVQYVLKSPELFSSARTPAVRSTLQDPRLAKSAEIFVGNSLISADPPVHTRLRKLINAAFTPRAIARLERRVRDLTRELVDEILKKDELDLMEDLAVPLPVIVISEMLGVDTARRADFKRWSDDLVAGSRLGEQLPEEEIERLIRSREEFIAYFREAIAERRTAPREDLLSDLVRAEAERDMLSPEEVLSMSILLMIAGNETTTNLIGNGTLALLDHPAELRKLREDPSLIPAFIEEVLRYRSPVMMLVRTAREDVTLRGVAIQKGDVVAAMLDAANHDPSVFPDPDRFDITRPHPAHLSFGAGIHFCVGAPLSRLEGKIAFEEMLRRFPAFERKPGDLTWNKSFTLRGLRTLPIRFDRGAQA